MIKDRSDLLIFIFDAFINVNLSIHTFLLIEALIVSVSYEVIHKMIT